MPLKLISPKEGRSKVFRVRGTYLGVYLDRTTETAEKALARKLLKAWEHQIEHGEISGKQELTFAAAALSYLRAGGENRFLGKITRYFGEKFEAREITQAILDEAAIKLYPTGTASTRNRQLYAPISAVLRHAGVKMDIKRPKGSAGNARRIWLKPEQFEQLYSVADQEDPEFGILTILLCYTGLRLSEALRLKCEDISLTESIAFCGRTKNGDPRAAYLPPRLIMALANHPRGLDRRTRLFRWSKCGELYLLAERIYSRAGVDHGGAPFHVLRHTYGTMMTRIGADLVATGAWKSVTAARIYQHFDLFEEAKKADLLPGAKEVKK
jgi:integrase